MQPETRPQPEVVHQLFRCFQYQENIGLGSPGWTSGTLLSFAIALNTKKQGLELLVLEQFLLGYPGTY